MFFWLAFRGSKNVAGIQLRHELHYRHWYSVTTWTALPSLVFSYGMNCITVTDIQLRHELHYRHWYSVTAWTALPSLVFSYGMNYITVTGIQLRHELHYRHWYSATAWTTLPSLVFSYGMNCITVTGIQSRHELHYRHKNPTHKPHPQPLNWNLKWHLERKIQMQIRTATERHVRLLCVAYVFPPQPFYKPTVVNCEIQISVVMTNKLATRLRWQERCESAKVSLKFIYVARHSLVETELVNARTL
jgi:hypothetical protein